MSIIKYLGLNTIKTCSENKWQQRILSALFSTTMFKILKLLLMLSLDLVNVFLLERQKTKTLKGVQKTNESDPSLRLLLSVDFYEQTPKAPAVVFF